jgi:hypothetical protein
MTIQASKINIGAVQGPSVGALVSPKVNFGVITGPGGLNIAKINYGVILDTLAVGHGRRSSFM